MAQTSYLASSTLVEAIRDLGMLPMADDDDNTAARLIRHANREQQLFLTRLMLSVREEYQTATVDITLTGETRYRIPSRAVASSIRRLVTVDADGQETPVQSNLYKLEGNEIVFHSAPAASALRVVYPRRLNEMVIAAEAGEITAINTTTRAITLSSVPTDFSSTQTYDLIQGTPHFDLLAYDQAATLAGSVLTFAEALPEDLAIGDYVALKGQTPVCMAPLELHVVLAYRVNAVILQAKGDPKTAGAVEMLAAARDDAMSLLEPRKKDEPTIIQNPYAPGWRRGTRLGNRRWRG